MSRRALQDKWFWLTRCTKTVDEQDQENPYKPFPDKDYLRLTLDVYEHEPIVIVEKSRTMLCSWLTSGYCAHEMFNRPAVGVIFQSADEARAVHDVDYVKALWDHSLDPLKQRWKLARPLHVQPFNRMEMANGSWCMGITGGPDKIRSEHPTIVVLDEAAFIDSDANFNVAMAARPKKLIALSSANPGWFRELTEFAEPVDWPDYGKAA